MPERRRIETAAELDKVTLEVSATIATLATNAAQVTKRLAEDADEFDRKQLAETLRIVSVELEVVADWTLGLWRESEGTVNKDAMLQLATALANPNPPK